MSPLLPFPPFFFACVVVWGGGVCKNPPSQKAWERGERETERERERKRKRVNDLGGGKRERIPRNQKNGEKRGTTHVDQHEKDETRESDTVLGRNDGADDGAEKTQLRRVEMRARDGTAR